MNMLLLAFAAVNPLDFPSYDQEVVATFATVDEARAAVCEIAPLPDDAEVAFGCRWDDTNPADLPKGEMMVRAGVKGNFYFVGNDHPFYTSGPKPLVAMGHAIGNHTIGHPHMMTVSPNRAFREIAANRIKLEQVLQRTVTSYVSPFGWQQAPLDRDHAPTIAAALVASGHFVSQDNEMAWSGLSGRTWMWANRFSANDRDPDRSLFVKGFTCMLEAAKKNRDAPRVTLGTHAWCDEKGNALQEAWLKEFFHPAGAVQLNDWEYGAYRYQYFHGGVRKTGVDGVRATYRVTRYAAAHVGDAIALSLRFSASPTGVTGPSGAALARAPRGTWTLPQDAVQAKLPAVTAPTDGPLTIVVDEAKAVVTLRFANATRGTLADVYLAAALPPKWSERRLTASCATLKPGATFERTFSLGCQAHPDYAYGVAYYPVSADYVEAGVPRRVWATVETAAVEEPNDVPARAVRVWGPAPAAPLADVDWAAVSVPGAELPDAANWKAPARADDGLWNAVTEPIKVSRTRGGNLAIRELLERGEHARYIVYDFTAEADGMRRLRLNYRPKHRSPFVCVNGVKAPFTGDGQKIAVKKGANRLIVRADTLLGDYYTDTLYLTLER